jgi:hypothetical protein
MRNSARFYSHRVHRPSPNYQLGEVLQTPYFRLIARTSGFSPVDLAINNLPFFVVNQRFSYEMYRDAIKLGYETSEFLREKPLNPISLDDFTDDVIFHTKKHLDSIVCIDMRSSEDLKGEEITAKWLAALEIKDNEAKAKKEEKAIAKRTRRANLTARKKEEKLKEKKLDDCLCSLTAHHSPNLFKKETQKKLVTVQVSEIQVPKRSQPMPGFLVIGCVVSFVGIALCGIFLLKRNKKKKERHLSQYQKDEKDDQLVP